MTVSWFGFSQLMAVMIGAALGASIRWILSAWFNVDAGFAWGTLIANLVGALAIGYLVSFLHQHAEFPTWIKLFLITGLLGGLTTFSSFSIESVQWWLKGESLIAVLHILAHLLGSLLFTYLGIKIYTWL